MRQDWDIPATREMISIYWCDRCGKGSGDSDYWWPGHQHWEESNYTLCYGCLTELANYRTEITKTDRDSIN